MTVAEPVAVSREEIEAKARRLMAELARMPNTWQTRQRRTELRVQIDEALEEFNTTPA